MNTTDLINADMLSDINISFLSTIYALISSIFSAYLIKILYSLWKVNE